MYLSNRDRDQLWRSLVKPRERLTSEEALQVGSDDGGVPAVLAQLLLFGQVADVSHGEDAWMALHLKRTVDLDEPTFGQHGGTK